MSIQNQDTNTSFTSDGTTTVFPFSFKVFEDSDLRLVVVDDLGSESELELETDYTVSLNVGEGGSVTLNTALTLGYELYIFRNTAIENDLEITQNYVNLKQLENKLDMLTVISQEQNEFNNRSIKLNEKSNLSNIELKEPVFGKYLKFDAQRNITNSDIDYSEILNPPDLVTEINQLTDVDTTGATVGDSLILNSSGVWVPSIGGAPVESVNGEAGVIVLDKTDIGLENVDNTSDADKPVSTPQQNALNLKANSAALGAVALSNDYDDLDNLPTLFSGSYDDLTDTPIIEPLNSDAISTSPYTADPLSFRSFKLKTGASEIRLPAAPSFKGYRLRFYREEGFSDTVTFKDLTGTITYHTVEDFEQLDSTDAAKGKYFELEPFDPDGTGSTFWTNVGSTRGGDGGGGLTEVVTKPFTGNGTQTEFILDDAVATTNLMSVRIGAAYQLRESYSIAGNTLTFSTAPLDGNKIEVTYFKTLPSVQESASGISTIPLDGDGTTTTFALGQSPLGTADMIVFVGGTFQPLGTWGLSGSNIVFGTAPPTGTGNIVVHIFSKIELNEPADNSVVESKIASGAVTPDKIPDVIFEEKRLVSDIGPFTSSGNVSSLSFVNKLTIGSSYRVEGHVFYIVSGGVAAIDVSQQGIPSSGNITMLTIRVGDYVRMPFSFEFKAQGTDLTFNYAVGGGGSLDINGGDSLNETYIKITKLPYNLSEGTL